MRRLALEALDAVGLVCWTTGLVWLGAGFIATDMRDWIADAWRRSDERAIDGARHRASVEGA